MDRARPGLIAVLAAVALALAACSTAGSPAAPATTGSTPARANPTPSGYPLAKGRQIRHSQGQTGEVSATVGDVLAVYRPTMGTRPSGTALVLADVTDTELIYQAVSAGTATLATDDPPSPPCTTTPCAPGGAAPPVVTVTVSAAGPR